MFKLYRAALLSAMLTVGMVSASAQTTDQQADMEILQKEVTCLIVNEYAIRHFNLFASQLDLIDDASDERRKIAIPLMAMSLLMKADADMRITKLINGGIDKAAIQARIDELTNGMYEKYSQSYIASTDYDRATEFVKGLFAEQNDCETWFKKTFGGELIQKPDEKQKGGVDG